MKGPIPLILILVAAAPILGGGFYWHSRRVQVVSVQVNVQDLPRHGLSIISSLDPSFDRGVSAILKGKSDTLVGALKPFSVLVKNTGTKAVVAYQLKWEMVKPDGSVSVRYTGGSNPRALMDGGAPGFEELSTTSGFAIAPSSTRFASLIARLDDSEGGIAAFAGSSDKTGTASLEQAVRDKNLEPMRATMAAELLGHKSVTVSIDGAFFEDGTFVGPDTGHFFDQVKAGIDAKRDLLEEIAFAVNHNRSTDQIFGDVKEWVGNSPEAQYPKITSTDYYNYYKRVYAEEVLHMKKAVGGDEAIAMALQPLRKAWPKLEKQ